MSAMISINIACTRNRKGNFFEFIHRVLAAALHYPAISVVLASDQELELLMKTLDRISIVNTVFYLHTIGVRDAGKTLVRVDGQRGSTEDPLARAAGITAEPPSNFD